MLDTAGLRKSSTVYRAGQCFNFTIISPENTICINMYYKMTEAYSGPLQELLEVQH